MPQEAMKNIDTANEEAQQFLYAYNEFTEMLDFMRRVLKGVKVTSQNRTSALESCIDEIADQVYEIIGLFVLLGKYDDESDDFLFDQRSYDIARITRQLADGKDVVIPESLKGEFDSDLATPSESDDSLISSAGLRAQISESQEYLREDILNSNFCNPFEQIDAEDNEACAQLVSNLSKIWDDFVKCAENVSYHW